MAAKRLDSLPTDILFSIMDHMSLSAKVSLVLCNKTLFNSLNGSRQLQYLRYDGVSLRYFLGLLEQDLPLTYLYCSIDCKFHRFSVKPENAGSDDTSTSASMSEVMYPSNKVVEFHFSGKERCRHRPWETKISKFMANTNFWSLRAALKLSERNDPATDRYLRSLNYLANVGAHPGEFLSCEWRVAPQSELYKPLVLLRLQHWYLVDGEELERKWHPPIHALNAMVCLHGKSNPLPNSQPTWSQRFEDGFESLQAMQKLANAATAVPQHTGLSRLFSWKSNSATSSPAPAPFSSHYLESPYGGTNTLSAAHRYTDEHHCFQCRAQYRVDMIQVPCSPKLSFASRSRFSRGQKSQIWAIVVTKWSCIGNANARYNPDLWNYIIPNHLENDPGFLTLRSMEMFEGKNCSASEHDGSRGYKPIWTQEMEENVTEWVRDHLVIQKKIEDVIIRKGRDIRLGSELR